MVLVEAVVLFGFLVVAGTGLNQSPAVLWHPVIPRHSAVESSAAAGILSATVASVFAHNGADASLYYSEETRARPKEFAASS